MVELIYIDIRCHIYRIRDRKKKKINREYSGTVNIVGVDRKLIIMFIFANACTPYYALGESVYAKLEYPYLLFRKACTSMEIILYRFFKA